VPLTHSTTSSRAARWWRYTCRRTCCSPRPRRSSRIAYHSGAWIDRSPRQSPSADRNGSSPATSWATTWLGSSKLAGICTASWPPSARAPTSRPNSAAWSGSQCRAALENTTSQPPPPKSAMSPSSNRRPWLASGRARWSIAGELSTPSVWPAPSRRWSKAVSSPLPQPRSTTRPPGTGRTRPSRSWNGWARSAAKRAYCSGFQVSISHHTIGLNRPGRRPISPAWTPDPGNGSR
jgi:hypothetical protein